jgi:hypothetical protein
LIQALFMFRSVLDARAIPCRIASSKLFADVELISEIFATDMGCLLVGDAFYGTGAFHAKRRALSPDVQDRFIVPDLASSDESKRTT